jgi:tetratricopeptide (TPR) repeat protein
VANLFTAEFYALASRHLRPGGVFCQFFHYYSMGPEDVKLQFRTFARAFPYASMWLVPGEAGQDVNGDLLLIGSPQPHALDAGRFEALMQDPYLAGDLRSLGLEDSLDLYSQCLLGHDEMLAFAGEGPLNTDDRPALEFSAPRSLFRSKEQGRSANREHFFSLDKASSAAPLPLPLSGLPGLAPGAKAPLRAAALAGLARRSLKLGLAQRSARLFESAYAISRLGSADLAAMGEAFAQVDRLEQSAQLLFQALAKDPGLRSAYLSLGRVQLKAREFPSSKSTFERMASRFPKDAEAWFGIATSAAYMGDYAQAEAMAQRTLSVDPKFERATRMLEQLKGRR